MVRLRIGLLVAFIALFILAPTLAQWYTDWLWFGEVGYQRVFWVPLLSRIVVTAVVGGVLFVLLWLNLQPFLRMAGAQDIIDLEPDRRARGGYRRVVRGPRSLGLVVG